MISIQIQSYKDKKTERLCTDYAHAKKKLDLKTAEKLFSILEFIRSSNTLKDVACIRMYNLHQLKGDRKGLLSMDIDGRRSSYRLIIEPIENNLENLNSMDFLSKCSAIRCISIVEVSKHYE